MKEFACIGVLTCVVLFILGVVIVVTFVKELVSVCVYNHKIKHRFSKPPLAKCYCIDCDYWSINKHECEYYPNMSEICFCCRAFPRKTDLKENIKNKKEGVHNA